MRQFEQRHLPRPAALRVAVVVELVDDGDVDGRFGTVAQRPVGEDLGGAADDRCVGVDGGVAGDHPDAIRAEVAAEGEELLADERLDRCGVDAALALRERREVGGGGDERLPRTGRRVEDHVVADEQLEDRLLLCRVELEADRRGVRVEPVEHGVGVVFVGPRRSCRQVPDERRDERRDRYRERASVRWRWHRPGRRHRPRVTTPAPTPRCRRRSGVERPSTALHPVDSPSAQSHLERSGPRRL